MAGYSAPATSCHRSSPAGPLRGQFQDSKVARMLGEQVAAERDGVLSGSARKLVERRLDGVSRVSVGHGAPRKDRYRRSGVVGLDRKIRDIIGRVGEPSDAAAIKAV